MTDPRCADFSVSALRHASERGQTHKHRLMAWAADRIEELEGRLTLAPVYEAERFDPQMRVSGAVR